MFCDNLKGLGAFSRQTRSPEHFPDPFCDMASLAMPESIRDALLWSEYIIMANGPYREALRRVISYFITDITIVAAGDKPVGREERKKYEDFLNDTIGIKDVLADVALDYLTYGNSFTSILVPFRRYLACGNDDCGLELPLKRVANTPQFKYSFSNYEFRATCPHCGYSGKWRHIDRRSGESGKIRVKRWNPHFIDVRYDMHSTDREYLWRIPDVYRNQIRRGELFQLEHADWEIVEAIAKNEHLLLDPEVIYHMHESTLAGLDYGWGYSRTLTNFRQAWYMQVLHRFNEAIALDYIIPFRVITPQPRPGGSGGAGGGEIQDPALTINMGDFVSRVNAMLAAHRRDPARWNVMPVPVQYQALGGEASQLAPKELLELALDTLLNSVGVPVELYRGGLTAQAAPAALRLFEANWSHLTHKLNRFLAKVVEKLSQVLHWEPVVARLQRVRVADDINRQMAILQLMMGGQISKSTGLEGLQLVFEDEARRKLEEEQVEAEVTQKAQEEMEQAADLSSIISPTPIQQMVSGQGIGGAGGAPPGDPAAAGAPPGGPAVPPMGPMGAPQGPGGAAQQFAAGQPISPNQPITLEELDSIAETHAAQMAGMPDSQRRSALIRLRQTSEALHALVKSKLDRVQQDAALQGREMVMQQQYGKQGSSVGVWKRYRQTFATPPPRPPA